MDIDVRETTGTVYVYMDEGRMDIIEESITALGHLYSEIKGAQTAGQLNDGHYVNKKTTERAGRTKGRLR